MAKPQVSFAKRQREQAKKERREIKAAKRAERKTTGEGGDPDIDLSELVTESPIDDTEAR